MFVFKKEQQAFEIGGVTIGGHPGQHPTVLVGGMFFTKQPIVENTKEGRFNKNLAREWIDTGVSMVEKTGHPLMIQSFGRTELAMERHLSWLSENFDGPIMFESTNAKARIRGIEFCEETGLNDRAIFNSINLSLKEEEEIILRNSKLNNAVVLGWSPKATTLDARMETIREMVSNAEGMGIDQIIVDPATLPVGAGYGLEHRTMLAVKSEFGLPTCLAPHNAPSAWKFIRQSDLDSESIRMSAVVASSVAAQLFATDCIMYGSMIRTQEVFTAIALIGNAISAAIAEAYHVLEIDREIFDPPTFQ